MLFRNILFALFCCALAQSGFAANLDIGLSADIAAVSDSAAQIRQPTANLAL